MRTAANGVLLTVLLIISLNILFTTETYAKRPVLQDDSFDVCAESLASSAEKSNAASQQPVPKSISYRPSNAVETEPVTSESVTTVLPLPTRGAIANQASVRDSLSSVSDNRNAELRGIYRGSNEQDLRYARWRPASVYGETRNNPRLLSEPDFQSTPKRRYGFLPLQGSNKNERQVSYRDSKRPSVGKRISGERQEVELKSGRASYLRPNVSTDLFYSSRK